MTLFDNVELDKAVNVRPSSALKAVAPKENTSKASTYLSAWDKVDSFITDKKQLDYVRGKNIDTVYELTKHLGTLGLSEVRDEFETELQARSMKPTPIYGVQLHYLQGVSGNQDFFFDVFGNLRFIDRGYQAHSNVRQTSVEILTTVYSASGDPLSLANLDIPVSLQRALRKLGIGNIPKLLLCNSTSLRNRGLRYGEISSISTALSAWPKGRLSLGHSRSEVEAARLAVISGWYPRPKTSVSTIERVTDLSIQAEKILKGEGLPVFTPSFRIVYCPRLLMRLDMGGPEYRALNDCLSALRVDGNALPVARATIRRLGAAACATSPTNSISIESLRTAPASLSSDKQPSKPAIAVASSLQSSQATAPVSSMQHGSAAQTNNTPKPDQPPRPTVKATAFNKWFSSLPVPDRMLLGYMLVDPTPSRWVEKLGKNPTFIFKRYREIVDSRPLFEIDAYHGLFEGYFMTAEQFFEISETQSPAFVYMKRFYRRGNRPLKDALTDESVSSFIRTRVCKLFPNQVVSQPKSVATSDGALALESAVASPAKSLASPERSKAVPSPHADAFQSEDSLKDQGPFSIDEWLSRLNEEDAKFMAWLLDGNRLTAYPDRPWSVRGLREKRDRLLKERPRLNEDAYTAFFERYEMDEKSFCAITGASARAFNYLNMAKSHGVFNLELAVNDLDLSRRYRERIEELTGGAHGASSTVPLSAVTPVARIAERDVAERTVAKQARAPRSLRSALCAFAKTPELGSYHTLDQVRDLYQRYLDDTGQAYRNILRLPEDDQRAVAELRGASCFLVVSVQRIRSYKVDSRLTSELRNILTTSAGRNIECGAGLILSEHEDLFALYDIRDGEELYEYIRSYVHPECISGLKLVSMPIIRLGKADRKSQLVDILRESGCELTREEFARCYAQKFGVAEKTVRSNYLRDMKAYERNGRFCYVDTQLTDEQKRLVMDAMSADYMSLSALKIKFSLAFDDTSVRLLNDENLNALELEISRDLVVRKGVDLKRAFLKLLRSSATFTIDSCGFGEDVVNHPEFRTVLAAQQRDLQIIECERGSYITLQRLGETMGISRSDLVRYAHRMYSTTMPRTPFTIASLRKGGFSDPLDEKLEPFGFDNTFFESLVINGLRGEAIKRTRVGGVAIFCRQGDPFSRDDALELIVDAQGPIDVGDLSYLLEDTYGVKMPEREIRQVAESENNRLFHNEDLDMVMPSKEDNAVYLAKLLQENRL